MRTWTLTLTNSFSNDTASPVLTPTTLCVDLSYEGPAVTIKRYFSASCAAASSSLLLRPVAAFSARTAEDIMIVVKIIEGGGHDGYKSIATSTGKTVHAYVSTWKTHWEGHRRVDGTVMT
jgi:hypothetical protein